MDSLLNTLRKIFFLGLMLFVLFPSAKGYALSDSEHQTLMKLQQFRKAEQELTRQWKQTYNSIPKENKKELLDAQRAWIKSGRDEVAKKFQSTGMNKADAYTLATFRRIGELQVFEDNSRLANSETRKVKGDGFYNDIMDKKAFDVIGESKQVVNNHKEQQEIPNTHITELTDSPTSISSPQDYNQSKNSSYATPKSEVERIQVEAQGSGQTKMQALEAAWAEAVRSAVGMYMSSSTNMVDDAITEQIATLSRGQVDSYKILDEKKVDGLWTVSISANIDKDILEESVQASQNTILAFDGGKVAAAISTQEYSEENIKKIIEMNNFLDFSGCIDYSAKIYTGKNDKGKHVIVMEHVLRPNLEKFFNQQEELEKLIKKIAEEKYEIPLGNGREYFELCNKKDVEFYKVNFSDFGNREMHDEQISRYSSLHISSISDNTICFIKDFETLTCYKVTRDIVNLFTPNWWSAGRSYKIRFSAKFGDSLSSKLYTSQRKIYFMMKAMRNGVILLPMITTSNDPYSSTAIYAWGVRQELRFTKEQLANMKQIQGEYQLEPNKE